MPSPKDFRSVQQIIQEFLSGPRGCRPLARAERDALIGYARWAMGIRDRDSAEEIVEEVLIRMWQMTTVGHGERQSAVRAPLAYFRKALRNAAIDHARRKALYVWYSLDTVANVDEHTGEAARAPVEPESASERFSIEQLRSALHARGEHRLVQFIDLELSFERSLHGSRQHYFAQAGMLGRERANIRKRLQTQLRPYLEPRHGVLGRDSSDPSDEESSS